MVLITQCTLRREAMAKNSVMLRKAQSCSKQLSKPQSHPKSLWFIPRLKEVWPPFVTLTREFALSCLFLRFQHTPLSSATTVSATSPWTPHLLIQVKLKLLSATRTPESAKKLPLRTSQIRLSTTASLMKSQLSITQRVKKRPKKSLFATLLLRKSLLL